jgi:hypothetical protein
MSSSFRNLRGARAARSARICAAVATAVTVGTGAQAADIYWQPDIELRGEGHTNRDLASDSEASEDMVGYFADLGVVWGRRTQLSETRIRPRLRVQEFPDRNDLRRTEQFLDISSNRTTERTNLFFKGRYSRRDAYTAELLEPGFDSFDPGLPTSGSDTGRLLLSNRRTVALVNPGMRHQVTERDGFTAELTAQWVDYETEIAGTQENYDYERANVGWVRKLNSRTEFSLGPYASRYNSRVGNGADSNSYGVQFQLSSDWDERTRAVLTLGVDQENIKRSAQSVADRNETSWEALFGLNRRTLTGMLRMNVGRAIVPSGAGGLADDDQVNVQIESAMSPRWFAGVAARGERRRAHSVLGQGNDRNAATASAGLGWAATQTISLSGGYEFMYRKYVSETSSATDHAVFLSLRYRGLGPESQGNREFTPIEFPRW